MDDPRWIGVVRIFAVLSRILAALMLGAAGLMLIIGLTQTNARTMPLATNVFQVLFSACFLWYASNRLFRAAHRH